jgi:hypothetical protein
MSFVVDRTSFWLSSSHASFNGSSSSSSSSSKNYYAAIGTDHSLKPLFLQQFASSKVQAPHIHNFFTVRLDASIRAPSDV